MVWGSALQLVIKLIKAELVLDTQQRSGKWRWMSLWGCSYEIGMVNRAHLDWRDAVERRMGLWL